MIADRVRERRRVKASDLVPNEKNWRTHPESQKAALRSLMQEVGFAGAVLARELPDGRLKLIDGHCRAEIAGDEEISVLVLDVTEDEADTLLATYDPISAMAGRNAELFQKLKNNINTKSEAVRQLLGRTISKIKESSQPTSSDDEVETDDEQGEPEPARPAKESDKYPISVVLNKSEHNQWLAAKKRLNCTADKAAFITLMKDSQ